MIEKIKSWNTRQWIAVICGILIVLRAIFPSIRIDETSLWLLLVGIAVILLPDIGDLFSRVKKVKKGDLELEFEGRLEALKRRTEETESLIESEEIDFGAIPDDVKSRITGSLVEPRAALITLAVEIEGRLRELSEIHDLRNRGRFFSPRRAIEALVESNNLDIHVPGLFADFWAIRNEAVHGHKFVPERDQLFSLVELGMRILRILYASRTTGEPEGEA